MIKINKPKIRFKNFNDSWSLRKLSDTQTDFKDGNYGEAYPKETDLTSSTQGVPFLRGSDLDNGKLTLTNARYITQSKHNELISGHLIEDDIVIAVRGSLGSLGYVGPDNKGWNINSQLAIIRTRKIELIGNYLIQFLLSNRGNKEISSHITGTALKQLPIKQLKNIKVPIPKIEEQSAIGSLFRTLDDLLDSYKDNLANYQSLKATMLSKMFPKAGQTVPEIRLDGFEEEWELLEINDLADGFQSGGTPKTNVQEYWDGDIPWIQSSDLETNCLFKIKVQKSISEKGLKNSSAKIIPKDSIAVVTRVGVGKLAVMRHEYATSQDFLSLSNLKSNIEFTAYLLYRLLQKEVTQLQGTSIKGITKGELLSKKVLIPSLPEQQAIGAYFSNLDNLINSHQEKITQLETLKKKLLQDMFI